jgi:hypothetical protein
MSDNGRLRDKHERVASPHGENRTVLYLTTPYALIPSGGGHLFSTFFKQRNVKLIGIALELGYVDRQVFSANSTNREEFHHAISYVASDIHSALAQDESQDLAKKLSNPISSLISVPFQFNYNGDFGSVEDGSQFYVNVQPVIPITLNEDWNLISRTIMPIIHQEDIFPGAGTQTGLGDVTQSLFFSPSQSINGFTWGAGPVFLIPTATDELLGSEKWGAGPTAVALWQGFGWTIGALVNHIWSFAGDDDRQDISSTFLQPFISYTTPTAWTFTLNTESSYNWETEEWSVPINGQVSKLTRFGKQPVSLFAGIRYWADSPEHVGPEGWGARAGIVFLFPKN